MSLSSFVIIVWILHIILCYYLIHPIENVFLRSMLTCIPCLLLIWITCQNLPKFYASTLLIVAICWLTSIRLIDLIILSQKKSLTFKYFLLKILWIYFPIIPKESSINQWPFRYEIILIIMKFLINHWIYRWFMNCETYFNYERILMFYGSIMTISFILDVETILIRILTRNQYTLQSFTNFPIFSLSLREFWGQRYNKIVNTILKESIFEPIHLLCNSSTIAGLITFIVSGLLHVHLAFVTFNDLSSLFPTFMFFFLHGLVCSFEAKIKIQLPEYIRWLGTHIFLLLTAPLMLEPFMKKESSFLILNPPPLFNVEWISKLSLPNFCS